jgi:hypothetical protein
VTGGWRKITIARHFLEGMESMEGAIRKVEEPLARENGEGVHQKPQTTL